MRRTTILLALALLSVPSVARAQDPSGYIWIGGGLNMPSGDAADGLKSGFVGTAGYGWIVPSVRAWSFQVEGVFGSNDYKGVSGSMSLTGFMLNVGYDFDQKADAHPYVYGGSVRSARSRRAAPRSRTWRTRGQPDTPGRSMRTGTSGPRRAT